MSERMYDRKIAENKRTIKRVEEIAAEKGTVGSLNQERFWKDLSKTLKAHTALLENMRDMKCDIENFDTEMLTKQAEKTLEVKGYKTIDREAIDFGRADLVAQYENEFLIIEVKGWNDQVRSNQLVRYEDIMMTKHPLTPVKKIVLVLPVYDGNNFIVWGLKQLISESERVSSNP